MPVKAPLGKAISTLLGKSAGRVGRAPYVDMVTPEERAASIKFGAMLALHAHGIRMGEVDGAIKQALPSPMGAVDTGMKAIFATSLIAGIPMGIAAHMIGRSVSANRKSERERLARIKYYRDVTGNLEGGLTGAPQQKLIQ